MVDVKGWALICDSSSSGTLRALNAARAVMKAVKTMTRRLALCVCVRVCACVCVYARACVRVCVRAGVCACVWLVYVYVRVCVFTLYLPLNSSYYIW